MVLTLDKINNACKEFSMGGVQNGSPRKDEGVQMKNFTRSVCEDQLVLDGECFSCDSADVNPLNLLNLTKMNLSSDVKKDFERYAHFQNEKLSCQQSTLSGIYAVYNGTHVVRRQNEKEHETLKAYVTERGGCHVISRILIANNGNAAVKAIRSFRQWTFEEFGTDRLLEIVVMATQDDIEANAEYISEGDFLAEVPGGASENNYSNISLIVQIAEEYECQGVWPGWGHASENPKFPLALEASLYSPIWIGPSSVSMQLLGDKIGSTLIAQSLNIPCVPWSGSNDVVDVCNTIGYPVVIKASDGGGGRGIRKVFGPDDIQIAYYHVLSEVKDSSVFVMKLLQNCRHLEVQAVGDRFGQVAALGTRDCTVQRRCQKIIEEGPVVVAPSHVVHQMEQYAIQLLSAVKYLSVATCEFLYDVENESIYFLEVNPRLQVEHVVTEVVNQINLPAIQFQSVLGIPLAHIPGVLTSEKEKALQQERHCIAARITAEHAEENFRPTCGQVVELQLRSSMNAWGYFLLGVTGQVHRFTDSQIGHVFALGRNREEARCHLVMALRRLTVRGEIHTNVEALLRILELRDFVQNTTHTTWVEECVRFDDHIDSHFGNPSRCLVAKHEGVTTVGPTVLLAVALASACEAFLTFKRSETEFITKIRQGQLPPLISCEHSVELVYKALRFTLQCFHTGPYKISVSLNTSSTDMVLRPITLSLPPPSNTSGGVHDAQNELTSSACFLISGGPGCRSRRVFYKIDAGETSVTFDGSTFTFVKESDPTQVRAPVSGRLSRWLVPTGTPVTRGDSYADIEIMKMYMQLQVADDGILSHALAEGAVFKAGDLLATLEIKEGLTVQKCVDYTGTDAFKSPQWTRLYSSEKSSSVRGIPGVYAVRLEYPKRLRRFMQAKAGLECILNGYQSTASNLQEIFNNCLIAFLDPIFPMYELITAFESAGVHVPCEIQNFFENMISLAPHKMTSSDDWTSLAFSETDSRIELDGRNVSATWHYIRCYQLKKLGKLFKLLAECLMQSTSPSLFGSSENNEAVDMKPLAQVLQRYQRGLLVTAQETIEELLTQYLDVEEVLHQGDTESASKVLLLKRTELDVDRLAVLARSHQALCQKNDLVIQLLGVIQQYYHYFDGLVLVFNDVLQRLSHLSKPQYSAVSLRARQLLLMRHQQPFLERTLALTRSFAELLERDPLLPILFNRSQRIGNLATLGGAPYCFRSAAGIHHQCQPSLLAAAGSCSYQSNVHTTANHSCSYHSALDSSLHGHHHAVHCATMAQRVQPATSINLSPLLRSTTGSVGVTPTGCPSSLAFHSGTSGHCQAHFATMTECSSSFIQTFVDDWENVADDSLIALLAHPKPEFCKLAFEVYIRRHFEHCGLDNFKIGYTGEFWWRHALGDGPSQDSKTSRTSAKLDKVLESPTVGEALPVCKIFDDAPAEYKKFDESLNGRPALTLSFLNAKTDGITNIHFPAENVKNGEPLKCTDLSKKFITHHDRETPILNTAGLQRVNRLLAVWFCSAVLSYDFLTQCCDTLTESRHSLRTSDYHDPSNNMQVKTPGCYRETKVIHDHNDVHSCMTEQNHPMSLFVNHTTTSGAGGCCGDGERMLQFRKNVEKIRSSQRGKDTVPEFDSRGGLNSNSRLHHMLNAFGNPGTGESNTGQLHMVVAMAFQNVELFSNTFNDCLKEYSELQTFMPTPPPAVDGKILFVFISEVNDSKQISCPPSPSPPLFSSPNCSSWLEAVCQSHSAQLASLGFHIVAMCFLCGRHLTSLQFDECQHSTNALEDACGTCNVPSSEVDCCETVESSVHEGLRRSASYLSDTTMNGQIPFDDDPFDHFDLVCSRAPRYLYFRNLAVLPPLPITGETGDEDYVLEPLRGETAEFVEEVILRNVECSQFASLELRRLINFYITVEPVSLPYIHLFLATPKISAGPISTHDTKKKTPGSTFRVFMRILLHYQLKQQADDDWADLERHFVAGLNMLELTLKNKCPRGQRPLPSHHVLIYVNIQGPVALFSCNALLQSPSFHRISPSSAQKVVFALAQRYESRLIDNGVGTLEVRFIQHSCISLGTPVPIRIVITNPTRQSQQAHKFIEITDPTTGELIYSALDASDSLAVSGRPPSLVASLKEALYEPQATIDPGFPQTLSNTANIGGRNTTMLKNESVYDGLPVSTPHPLSGPLDEKRALAASLSTIYIYDFLELFAKAIKKQWRSCPKYFIPAFPGHNTAEDSQRAIQAKTDCDRGMPMAFIPDKVLESIELVLDENSEVCETVREPGNNDCGMVAWRVLMRTPEFPRGRRMILVGNDVTFQMGTFGLQEDLLYQRVSEIARREGIPRIYIAVNSGARMGLAKEVQQVVQVEWVDAANPAKGFKYLYLNEADYRRLRATDSVVAEPVLQASTHQYVYRLTSVIGKELGLGVENLCGSGAIAGETSRSYDSNVTITFVTGRTVGIGAYISRLGHRVIQKASSAPILLTGYQVINRLIRRDVYSSNDELGGVDVMAKNGVTHIVVGNDIAGCEEIIRWLSYVPEHTEGALPIMVDPTDPITRPVLYKVSSLTEDPRLMLTGCLDAKGRWLGGIVDRGSFREVLSDWAKSVIVGRARLGGIPLGIIAVETRVTETVLPADPAVPDSVEVRLLRPGQMWFPDSAYKTAQAISDFNREEIPLLILANWRGFSGGQRDMFYEVLKFGSFIVDALVHFKQPCIVYIPPKAELRGGAWVVVDPRINPFYMDMFADPDCRGGVLEPTGMVEIKFRNAGLATLAERLDPVLNQLSLKDQQLALEGVALDDPCRVGLKETKDKRLQDILAVYKQIAVHFADLHDTAVRMKKKDAIHAIVPWERSRTYFYWRLRRQLIFFNLRSEVIKAYPTLSMLEAEDFIYKWRKESGQALHYSEAHDTAASCELNAKFVQWACHALSDISRRLAALRAEYQRHTLLQLMRKSPQLVKDALHTISPRIKSYSTDQTITN